MLTFFRRLTSGLLCLCMLGTYSLAASALPRQMERLDRGVVAIKTSTGVFVSWRLLGLDAADIQFNLYRSSDGGAATKLNDSPLAEGTNFTDLTAPVAVKNTYSVRPVLDGVEQAADGQFTLSANPVDEPVVRVPITAAPGNGYVTRYAWVGDLDGDGQYDFVIDRTAPGDSTKKNWASGNQALDAYKMDGTHLWHIDMGPNSRGTYNISPGPATLSIGMWDGATVYDLNGDGKAELILKIANGVKFADGTTFSDGTTDEDQSIAIVDGLTGKLLASQPVPQNFASRGRLSTMLGIAYVDGVTPSVIFWGRNRNANLTFNDVFTSLSWKGGSSITTNWVWEKPTGFGIEASHSLRILDLDSDGKDEIMSGNFVINSDGTLRYQLPGVVHGDRFYVGKLDPSRAGMQGYGIQQYNPSGLAEYYYDATTGEILWTHSLPGESFDVGRGLAGDIDPRYPGWEVWSFYGVKDGRTGKVIYDPTLYPYPTHSIWWDGDLLTEGLNRTRVEKWNYQDPRTAGRVNRYFLLSSYGAALYGNLNPNFMGDILGDWRTEIVVINTTGTELLIFSTNIPTSQRLYTMAHNPGYRNSMALRGYLQSPMVDYYLGTDMATPPTPSIVYVGTAAGGETGSGDGGNSDSSGDGETTEPDDGSNSGGDSGTGIECKYNLVAGKSHAWNYAIFNTTTVTWDGVRVHYSKGAHLTRVEAGGYVYTRGQSTASPTFFGVCRQPL